MKDHDVPHSLRTWFVVHFAVDMLFGLPILLAPRLVLPLFGWQVVDPFTARIVGAVLMGIGIESLLGRNAGLEAFRAMLNLKIIWAGSAVFGMLLSLLLNGAPSMGWVFVAIFVAFGSVWVYYRLVLRKQV
ncbi:MAG: hypothetical protein JXA13_15215 [Anaerolineales bacterium]|nr:hypothetical protein [Anaerolineales bacterium]